MLILGRRRCSRNSRQVFEQSTRYTNANLNLFRLCRSQRWSWRSYRTHGESCRRSWFQRRSWWRRYVSSPEFQLMTCLFKALAACLDFQDLMVRLIHHKQPILYLNLGQNGPPGLNGFPGGKKIIANLFTLFNFYSPWRKRSFGNQRKARPRRCNWLVLAHTIHLISINLRPSWCSRRYWWLFSWSKWSPWF